MCVCVCVVSDERGGCTVKCEEPDAGTAMVQRHCAGAGTAMVQALRWCRHCAGTGTAMVQALC